MVVAHQRQQSFIHIGGMHGQLRASAVSTAPLCLDRVAAGGGGCTQAAGAPRLGRRVLCLRLEQATARTLLSVERARAFCQFSAAACVGLCLSLSLSPALAPEGRKLGTRRADG
eukprot:COSAG01_NODE_2180_length_8215_cov_3.853006_8_plen_114_part_00